MLLHCHHLTYPVSHMTASFEYVKAGPYAALLQQQQQQRLGNSAGSRSPDQLLGMSNRRRQLKGSSVSGGSQECALSSFAGERSKGRSKSPYSAMLPQPQLNHRILQQQQQQQQGAPRPLPPGAKGGGYIVSGDHRRPTPLSDITNLNRQAPPLPPPQQGGKPHPASPSWPAPPTARAPPTQLPLAQQQQQQQQPKQQSATQLHPAPPRQAIQPQPAVLPQDSSTHQHRGPWPAPPQVPRRTAVSAASMPVRKEGMGTVWCRKYSTIDVLLKGSGEADAEKQLRYNLQIIAH